MPKVDGDAFALYGGTAKSRDGHRADIAGEVAVGAGIAGGTKLAGLRPGS